MREITVFTPDEEKDIQGVVEAYKGVFGLVHKDADASIAASTVYDEALHFIDRKYPDPRIKAEINRRTLAFEREQAEEIRRKLQPPDMH